MKKLLGLIAPLFLVLTLQLPIVQAQVDFLTANEQLGTALGVGTFAGGILATVIVVFALMVFFAVATRRRPTIIELVLLTFPLFGFCVAISWFPVWNFAVLILVIALLFSDKIVGRFRS